MRIEPSSPREQRAREHTERIAEARSEPERRDEEASWTGSGAKKVHMGHDEILADHQIGREHKRALEAAQEARPHWMRENELEVVGETAETREEPAVFDYSGRVDGATLPTSTGASLRRRSPPRKEPIPNTIESPSARRPSPVI